jgi:hypothetical protein
MALWHIIHFVFIFHIIIALSRQGLLLWRLGALQQYSEQDSRIAMENDVHP